MRQPPRPQAMFFLHPDGVLVCLYDLAGGAVDHHAAAIKQIIRWHNVAAL